MEHDQLGRVTRRSIGAHNIEQSRTKYEWSKGNKLNKIINELSHAKTSFEYDEFDNLISGTYNESGSAETIYRVPDKIGNLFKTKNKADRKYVKGGKLLQDEKYNYYYDEEGNLVFKEFRSSESFATIKKEEIEKKLAIALTASGIGWQYQWKDNGMLNSVTTPHGKEINFKYDPLGRRIAKSVSEKVSRYVWDSNVLLHEWNYMGEYPPHTSVDEDGNLQEHTEPIENLITWAYEEGSFVPCAKMVEEESYSIVADYIGRPTHCYNKEGALVWNTEYDIYGKLRNLSGSETFIPFRQLGQYEDEELGGLYYNRFRYYDNESGNYISQDPIRLKGGYAIYSYVFNSNSSVDVFGLAPQPRTSDGKFTTKNPGDSAPGADEVAIEKMKYEADPNYTVKGEEISFRDENGQLRRYDLVVEDVNTKEIIGVEVKGSETASYSKAQRDFDAKLNKGEGGIHPVGKKAQDAGITKIDKTELKRHH